MSQKSNLQIIEDLSDQQLMDYTAKKLIAVDTELHGLKMNRDQICLIQLGDDASCASEMSHCLIGSIHHQLLVHYFPTATVHHQPAFTNHHQPATINRQSPPSSTSKP